VAAELKCFPTLATKTKAWWPGRAQMGHPASNFSLNILRHE
jgi:hypothetical protein